jgi:hypothetical protein
LRRYRFRVASRAVGGAAAYVLVLLMVANGVFLAGLAGGGGIGVNLARTGIYADLHVPSVTPVDPGQIAEAVTGGGQAAGARRVPDELTTEGAGGAGSTGSAQRSVPEAGPQAAASASVSSTTTPTYTAATKVGTLSIASLLAEIPLTVTFPPGAHKAATKGR